MMTDDEQAVAAITSWEKLNPPGKKFARKKLMNFLEFTQTHGVRASKRTDEREVRKITHGELDCVRFCFAAELTPIASGTFVVSFRAASWEWFGSRPN